MEKLYHIYKFDKLEDDIKVGSVLDFVQGQPNMLRQEQYEYQGSYLESSVTEGNIVVDNYKSLSSLLKLSNFKNQPDEEVCKRLALLDEYIHNSMLLKREMILEEVRRQYFADKPSRYSCMWLTDEECIDSWLMLLYAKEGHYSINEMELDGNLFVSTDDLLPNMNMKTIDMYVDANHYWNPTQMDLDKSIKREYLFEGTAKVKKKIK